MASGLRCDDLLRSLGITNIPQPRAPPRFMRPPSPLIIERPQPTVPDVSLLLDSAATSFYSNPEQERETTQMSEVNSTRTTTLDSDRMLSKDVLISEMSPGLKFANFIPTPPVVATNAGINSSYGRRRDDSGRETLTSPSPPKKSNRSYDADDRISTSRQGNSHERSDYGDLSVGDVHMLRTDVSRIAETISQQSDTITNLESQLKQVIAFQEKFLVHFLRKGSGLSKETQTDLQIGEAEGGPQKFSGRQSVSNSPSNNANDMSKAKSRSSQIQMQHQLHPPRRTASNRTSPVQVEREKSSKRHSSAISTPNSAQIPVTATSKGGRNPVVMDKNTEDVSAILRNLQITNVQGPSMYSESSIKLDFPQFNDDSFHNDNSPSIGPSASAYGSSSEDELETVVPTTTFYNNMLSTVNRILDTGEKSATSIPASGPNTQDRHTPFANPKLLPQTSNNGNIPTSTVPSGRANTTISYTSGSSSGGSVRSQRNPSEKQAPDYNENKENQEFCRRPDTRIPYPVHPTSTSNVKEPAADSVVDVTKKYLQSLGVQFDSPVPPHDNGNLKSYTQPSSSSMQAQQQNYMIQQNVYNSIYIPTVNCVPVVTESVNSNSGMMENLAHKYIPSCELNQYEILQNKNSGSQGITETTVYGMTPSNLSFATKQYLQRYGLVGQSTDVQSISVPEPIIPASASPRISQLRGTVPISAANDRILDITAIKNLPKLM